MHAAAKIAKKLEKSQNLLKFINSCVRKGRRVPSKICDFSDYSKVQKIGEITKFVKII